MSPPGERVTSVIRRFVQQSQAEGERDVQSNRFCIGTSTARVVINNTGPAAWNGQHAISMDWPDIAALDRVARLIDVTLLGPVTPEIVKWLANSG